MKQVVTYVFVLIISLIGLKSTFATQHIILAQGTTIPTDIFVPQVTYAVVGDTIVWVWVDGTHTTESVTIPPGAASFNAFLDSGADTFIYVLTVPGTYYFDCHASIGGHGMDGYIEVSAIQGIENNGMGKDYSVYPNPFSEELVVRSEGLDEIKVYNLVGKQVLSIDVISDHTVINTKELPKGFYFVSLLRIGETIQTKKLTKR